MTVSRHETPEGVDSSLNSHLWKGDPRSLYFIMMIAWTLLILFLVSAFTYYARQVTLELLRSQAGAACDRDLLFRAWNSKFGGVYVPNLDPNPWLIHSKRDITTNFGDRLTLVNPAWMTRQINELQSTNDMDHDVRSRLTSSQLLNPNNAPDDWEREAMRKIESGAQKEVFELVRDDDNVPTVRLARPLIVSQGCLNCHGFQGYQVGDIRGIISMEVDAMPLQAVRDRIILAGFGVGSGIWLIGMGILVFSRRRLKVYFAAIKKALDALREKEASLRKHRDHLEELVDERTQKLREATETAEIANSAKSRFLAHMSHEIRTPLNGVIGLSNLLAEEPLTQKQSEFVRMICLSGETLLSLVNDILDFSKIEAGKLELNIHEFDLAETLHSILGILATRFYSKNLELCLDMSPDVPRYVYGDGGRLLQIILNFAGNSAKFTETGGVRISLHTLDRNEQRVKVRFRIADTGIGVEEDLIPYLFESYAQADASIASRYGGTGLGLPIAQGLIQLMGGDLTVHSKIGCGTAFEFVLSFRISPLETRYAQQIPIPSQGALSHLPTLRGRQVLVVDDNEVLCQSLDDQFHYWEMDVSVAAGRKGALERLEEADRAGRPFDLIVLDESFDGVRGSDLLAEIRQKDHGKSIPAVLLVSLQESDPAEYDPDGEFQIVKKPFSVSALYDTVLTALYGDRVEVFLLRKKEIRNSFKSNALQGRSRRILVAEDNVINQIVIVEMLRARGYSCDLVSDGRQAVEACAADDFDLVLMDCQMPEMDGYEATAAIRLREKSRELLDGIKRHLPIIALTANATVEDRSNCLRCGMDDYCSKPIKEETLFEIVARQLEKHDGIYMRR